MHYHKTIPEDSIPIIDQIQTGHYDRGDDYRCWRSRGIASWVLKYTLSGTGTFGACPQDHMTQGDAVLIPPYVPHDYWTARGKRWGMMWAVFDPPYQWIRLLDWPEWGGRLRRLRIDPPTRDAIAERLTAMHRLARHPGPDAPDLALNALEGALLMANTVNPRATQRIPLDPAAKQALEYISENLDKPITLGELARLSGQSVARLCYMFKRHLGASPQAYIESRRIARACQLLHRTPLAVKEVAEQLGYSSPFYFARRFTRAMGVSPRAYRARVLGPDDDDYAP